MRILLATAILSGALGAQVPTFRLAFPQDSTKTSFGILVPFGGNASGSIDEGRFQQLIPARHLPGAGTRIFGLAAFTVPGTGTLSYSSLKITLGHTSSSTLSSTFANNLPNPQVVYSRTNPSVSWSSGQWVPIPFDTPFVHDGSHNLVIDVQKVLASTPAVTFTHGMAERPGLPPPRYEFGARGSGAARAAIGRYSSTRPLRIRLLVETPTLYLESDPGGSNNNTFALGTPFDIHVHGTAGSLYGTLLSTAWGPGAAFPPLQGTYWLTSPARTLEIGSIPPGGFATTNLTIPGDPALVGLQVVFQAGTLGATPGSVPRWTCAADLIIKS